MNGKKELKLEPINLKNVIEEEIEKMEIKYDEPIFSVDEIPEVNVKANELLNSVFKNLLNNAVRHNDKRSTKIHLSFSQENNHIIVSIADNGPGISEESKDEIFGIGEKGLESTGTGVGLYLVRTLVQKYDGKVWIEDNKPEGSIFKVELQKA